MASSFQVKQSRIEFVNLTTQWATSLPLDLQMTNVLHSLKRLANSFASSMICPNEMRLLSLLKDKLITVSAYPSIIISENLDSKEIILAHK